jgi:single-stranded DNA-binding protein
MNIAKFTFIGRVTREPETKTTKSGPVSKITVAVNRRVGGEDVASFFDIEGWDKTSEHLSNFEKGQLGYFEGEIYMDEFPAKDKAGNEIMTDDGKKVMRRVTKFKCYGSRYGVKSGENASPPAGPKGNKGKKGEEGEEDVPW